MSHDPTNHAPHTHEELSESLHAHDEWFRHSPEEHHQEAHGSTNARIILAFLAATVLFVFGTGFIVFKHYEHRLWAEQVRLQELRTPRAEYLGLRAEWQQQLNSFAWTNQEAGRVRVPLEVAKRLVMEEYRTPGMTSK